MKIKKLLIVPSDGLVEDYSSSFFSFALSKAKTFKRKFSSQPMAYDAELQRYADIPKILGQENAFVFGALYSHLYSEAIPKFCPYPSCHGTPKGRTVREKEIISVLKEVDAVLVSGRAGQRGEFVIREAKKNDLPVAILDAHDHQSNYGAADIRQELCRGFKKGEHFDLYFKNDLPLGYKNDYILPLAPCPVRPEMYQFRELVKDSDFFFSGKTRVKDQDDGRELIELVQNKFDSTHFLGHQWHDTFLSAQEYWDCMSRSRIALSPSRFVWDSFRHCEAGLAPKTALVAPKPYVETIGPPLEDGLNAILYDTEFRDGKYHFENEKEFEEKLRYYLDNPEEREQMSERWAGDVGSGHTILARSKYILESMEQAF